MTEKFIEFVVIEKINKLFSLTIFQWWVILLAVILLPTIALSLFLLGYQKTKYALEKFVGNSHSIPSKNKVNCYISDIVRAVSIAANYGPCRANCLKKSLLIWWLLARRGVKTNIKFGTQKITSQEFGAHAWIDYDGKALNDSDNVQQQILTFQ